MRCLQCGKGIPLFKRLGGSSEFCSDAHRKEYQREYSQLALGRLMQSHPSEPKAPPVQGQAPASVSSPAINETPVTPAMNGAPAAAKTNIAPAWAEQGRPAPPPAAKPNGIGNHQPPPAILANKAVPSPAASQPATANTTASQPATAKLAVVKKPAPAELQLTLLAAPPEFEHAFASLAPDRPRRQPDMMLAELPQGGSVAWGSGVEIANSTPRLREHNLELRDLPRPNPRIALDLRIVPPESLETESWPLAIPIALAEPPEASLWTCPHRGFAQELASLGDFANDQFSKSDFEAPAIDESPAVIAVPEPPSPEPQAAAPEPDPPALAECSAASVIADPMPPDLPPATVESEPPPEEARASLADSETIAPKPEVRIPDPELNPLPVSAPGIAAGRAKPLLVFGAAPISTGTVQIPQPNGLPLRPVMVLAAAAAAVPSVKTGVRKRGNLLSRSALSIKAEVQESKTSAPLSSAPNLGLPELPVQTPAGPMASPMASKMHKILAALAGAAVLGAGIFFFLGKQSNAGLKSPTPMLANSAQPDQWIANFAPDAKRQRRVSLLRSSSNLSAYRVDFESSIQIKALGWVYRAQDSKNFYVSKIEFQKPGVNPVYALVHYAVINGVEQPRVETPLHVSVPMGGFYKIRFEAVGDRFTTWVQGQQVGQWSDPRLVAGGAGLYAEGAEQSILHGDFVVTPLSN